MGDGNAEASILDRRQFFTLGASFLLASSHFLAEIAEADAQTPKGADKRKLAEKFGKSAEKRVSDGIEHIKNTWGIPIEFANKDGTYGHHQDGHYEYGQLKDNVQKLHALTSLSRILLRYPPLIVKKGGLNPVNVFVKKILVTASLLSHDTKCHTQETISGTANYSKGLVTLRMNLISENNPRPELESAINEILFSHEVGHLYLNQLSEDEWQRLVVEKIKTFDPKYASVTVKDLPAYLANSSDCPFIEAQKTPEAGRPKGFVRKYGAIDHYEDIATVIEDLYGSAIARKDLDSEDPPILKAKIAVVKELLNKKIGFTDQKTAELYWSTVNMSATIDMARSMFREKPTFDISSLNFGKEFEIWEKFWKRYSEQKQ